MNYSTTLSHIHVIAIVIIRILKEFEVLLSVGLLLLISHFYPTAHAREGHQLTNAEIFKNIYICGTDIQMRPNLWQELSVFLAYFPAFN